MTGKRPVRDAPDASPALDHQPDDGSVRAPWDDGPA